MNEANKATIPPLTLDQYERIQPRAVTEHNGVKMSFATPSMLTHWRVQSIRSKEPCTLEWIESFQPDEVLVDCGANVGMYTVWAAATRGARVFAFEPEAQNYALLNRNILLNRLMDRVTAFCLGLSDTSGLSVLNMNDMRLGGSCHSVGEEVNFALQPMKVAFRQGCVVATLDSLIADGAVAQPAHIKIDVDGFEHKVISGALNTLADPRLKSLLIETNQNLPEHMAMVERLREFGFSHDPEQVARAERQEGTFKGVAEYIFRR